MTNRQTSSIYYISIFNCFFTVYWILLLLLKFINIKKWIQYISEVWQCSTKFVEQTTIYSALINVTSILDTQTVIIVIMKAYFFLDVLVLSVMLFLFYILFGKHSLCKFLKEETFILEKKVDFNPENPPAITICARKQGNGWKQEVDPEYYFKEFQ